MKPVVPAQAGLQRGALLGSRSHGSDMRFVSRNRTRVRSRLSELNSPGKADQLEPHFSTLGVAGHEYLVGQDHKLGGLTIVGHSPPVNAPCHRHEPTRAQTRFPAKSASRPSPRIALGQARPTERVSTAFGMAHGADRSRTQRQALPEWPAYAPNRRFIRQVTNARCGFR